VPSKIVLPFLVAVSVAGLALVPLFLLQPNLQADPSPLRRPAISVLYSAVCVLGIVAVFYPGKCRLMFQKPNDPPSTEKTSASALQFRGHHPDCEHFSANRITIGGRAFCAACSGLLVGAVVALAGTALFSLGYFGLAADNLWVLITGEVLMLVGLAQIKMRGFIKVAANALFVVGSFFCFVAVDLAGQSLLFDAYMLGLIVYLLWLRILLSEWNNNRICHRCQQCLSNGVGGAQRLRPTQ
jgi:hypothetical protein